MKLIKTPEPVKKSIVKKLRDNSQMSSDSKQYLDSISKQSVKYRLEDSERKFSNNDLN